MGFPVTDPWTRVHFSYTNDTDDADVDMGGVFARLGSGPKLPPGALGPAARGQRVTLEAPVPAVRSRFCITREERYGPFHLKAVRRVHGRRRPGPERSRPASRLTGGRSAPHAPPSLWRQRARRGHVFARPCPAGRHVTRRCPPPAVTWSPHPAPRSRGRTPARTPQLRASPRGPP